MHQMVFSIDNTKPGSGVSLAIGNGRVCLRPLQ